MGAAGNSKTQVSLRNSLGRCSQSQSFTNVHGHAASLTPTSLRPRTKPNVTRPGAQDSGLIRVLLMGLLLQIAESHSNGEMPNDVGPMTISAKGQCYSIGMRLYISLADQSDNGWKPEKGGTALLCATGAVIWP
ncbi:hypothetical protein FALBO_9630 [Fusarium albosuccineum]|uniref:Uncharacterized protein n=1 Tax=Fusarium albosuccineum TaxID=1237068 RepID=A0A8H4P5S1_9HYPO|nr:hypothetical protein FALBO_9630 [Fusarium albosuccineum]